MDYKQLRNKQGQTLDEFLASYQPKDYPHPSVTVDLLIFSLEKEKPELLMIRRGNHPYLQCWALPGGFVEPYEFTIDAAARELEEETHVKGMTLTEIGFFSGPGRDPRDWTMSCAYAAIAPRSTLSVQADDDAADSRWFTVDYHFCGNCFEMTLTGKEDTLTAQVAVKEQYGIFGKEYLVGDYQADGIAFDHCKMIALAMLKLRSAGRI